MGDCRDLVARAGRDFRIDDTQAICVDVRRMDISSGPPVNGDDVGTVDIDPIAYGIATIRAV